MRIGIVTGEYPPMQGGVGAYTSILAHHLAASGQEVFLFSTKAARSDDLPLTNHVGRWHPDTLAGIDRWVRKHHLEIVNLQYQTAAFGMSPWLHFLPDYLRRVPVVTTFHDLRFPYLFPKAGPLRDWIVMHLARASAGVVITNHEDEFMLRRVRCKRLIPIGSNILDSPPDHYDAAIWRERAGAGANDYLLAFFGLLNRSKGLEYLIESVAQLRKEGLPVRLLIVGGTGTSDRTNAAYAQEIDALIHHLDLDAFVHRTGFLGDETEVSSYLKASDVVVLPFLDGASFRRGSLMAAIHHACPIITTIPRVPVPEFVYGENMLLVKPGETPALTHALRQLRSVPELGQKLSEGAERLATRFDWEHITRDYIDFFTSLHGDRA